MKKDANQAKVQNSPPMNNGCIHGLDGKAQRFSEAWKGMGARSRIHTAKILRLSEDLPIVVEIVDTEGKVKSFMPRVDDAFQRSGSGGRVTLERADVLRYTHGK